MANRILIFEGSLSGHRGYYVRVLALELIRLGLDVSLALPADALQTPQGKEFLSDVLPQADFRPLPETGKLPLRRRANTRLELLIDAVQKTKACHTYVPYADGITQAWGMRPRPQRAFPKNVVLEGLMMRGGFAYPATNWKNKIRNELSWQLQKRSRWTRIHQLDPLVFSAIRLRNPDIALRTRLIPEAIEPLQVTNRQEACQQLGLDVKDTIIVCPGAVNESKGADRLARAVCDLPPQLSGRLVLWGKHSDGLRKIVAELGNEQRVLSIDRFATQAEFDCLFAAADLVAVCYPRHIGSASILLRAAAAEKRILASDFGWIGWVTKNYHLGTTCQSSSVADVRNRLVELLSTSNDTKLTVDDRSKAFINYHTLQNHLAHFTELLRETLGFPAARMIPLPNPENLK